MRTRINTPSHSGNTERRRGRLSFFLLRAGALGLAISTSQAACAQTTTTRGDARNSSAPVRPELIYHPRGNFSNNVARPLRYWPVDGDFVITNGPQFFNRPLYCDNTAFRIDGGDKPEFSLYLPGRGGNLRLGIKTVAGVKWLNDAQQIIARYRPGSLIYQFRDPLLGKGELDLTVVPLSNTRGVIARAELHGAANSVELISAFGGANGMRGRRGGDIGCEKEPVAQFFQLRPEECRGNEITAAADTFTLRGRRATIFGVASGGTTFSVGDADRWANPAALLASTDKTNALPVAVGRIELRLGQPVYLALQQIREDSERLTSGELPEQFSAAEARRHAVADRVTVKTPDPFINAAVPALNIAADAIWDARQKSFMHGAVAWRVRLLGWRGLYAGDELGWPNRTAEHFAGFAAQQNTNPIPAQIPPPDKKFNLARCEAAIHSNGDMTKSHYDMNLVAVDGFFRHLLWTGDTNYAREMWPVIVRHLAWERRLFRREFGPDKLPLYEAYAAIWASDDLGYNGAGTAHASAYNYFENKMAAHVARILGKDPTPYEREADLILRGMNKYLWLPHGGNFAEYKDYLGLQLIHPNSGLWTFYITMDSEVPTPLQAWQMTRWVDTHIAHIPVRGKNVPNQDLFVLPETSWMPYQWSLNNVVMAENAHTSLGYWEANRPETAFRLFKGELLDSMFLGLCPGNFDCTMSQDMARGESQRDFADPIGINARALVEGLFGVKPDALAGVLKIVPGFPTNWDYASIQHPNFNFSFRRDGLTETYRVEPKFPHPMKLNLQIRALRAVAEVTVNGKSAKWNWVKDLYGVQRIEIESPATDKFVVVVHWSGSPSTTKIPPDVTPPPPEKFPVFDWNRKIPIGEKLQTVNLAPYFNDKVTQIFRNDYRAPRTPFASLATPKQGIGGWCEPFASFDVNDSGLRALAAKNGGKIVLPDGIPFATPGQSGTKNIIFTTQWNNYPDAVTVPLAGKASRAFLLMAGSTSAMQSRFDNGEVIVTYTDGTTARLPLNNPVNWWPIDQDYFIDDYAFRRPEPLPPRVDLKTGKIRILEMNSFIGRGGKVPGGAATVLELPLNPHKELKSLTVRALANEVVIGLMSVTLER